MGLCLCAYKDREIKEEIDCFKPGWDKQKPLIELSCEEFNPTKDKCTMGGCAMCDCDFDTRYKICKETGYDELDEVIKEQGFIWITFDC